MTQEEALADQHRHAPACRANPDFVRKGWLYGGEGCRGGARARDAGWIERVRRTWGSETGAPDFETPP